MKSLLRLFFLFFISFTANAQTDHWETVVYENNIWKYVVPTSEPDTNWRKTTFTPTSWLSGQGGFGFGDSDDNTTFPQATSVYIRIVFNISDTSKISAAILNADYDDGFVAYLNNTEIVRANMPTGARPPYNTFASGNHEAVMYSGGNPNYFNITQSALHGIIRNGTNVLAIQIHNVTATSSDLSSRFWLSLGIKNTSVYFGTPPSWFNGPVDFVSSNLPIIAINTGTQTIINGTKITADMGIIYNGQGVRNYVTDPKNHYNGKIGIEIRGQSSLNFAQKQYNVETRDTLGNNLDVSLFGMSKENDWVLYAPYNDKTLMRNVITYQLAREMGRWAARTRFCEVTINGEYKGVYVFMEKIKRDSARVDVKKMNNLYNTGDSLTGGYIINIDKDTPTWYSAVTPNNISATQQIGFTIQYPDLADVTVPQKNYIKSYVDSFETALNSVNFQDPLNGYRKYAVVKSFVDFFIINEFTRNVDGYRLSTFLHKNRNSKGGQIKAGPVWDFNLGIKNANYCNGSDTSGWAYKFNNVCPSDNWVVPFWWDKLVADSSFSSKLYCKYTDLRTNLLDTTVLFAKIDSMVSEVNEGQVRHFAKYPILGVYVWPNPSPYPPTFSAEIRSMKNWIYKRLLWLDANMYGTGPCSLPIVTGNIKNSSEDINAYIYPNPFINNIHLELDIPSEGYYQIALYDAQGKMITVLTKDYFEKDAFGFNWNFSKYNLQAGLYFLQVKGDKSIKNFRIIKGE